MIVLREKIIDLSAVTETDKLIRKVSGSTLNLQLDGVGEITVMGSVQGGKDAIKYPLAIVNMSTMSINTTVSEKGIYMVSIDGIEEITLDIVGESGQLHWKEMGE